MTNSLNSKSVRNKKSSKPKSSAHYQRQYRKRLRDQGLVKKEVWILPQNHPVLLTVEKALRQHYADSVNQLKKLNNEAKRLLQTVAQNW